MNKFKFILLFSMLCLISFADAQAPTKTNTGVHNVYDDFIYTRQSVTERQVVPWPYLREADVFWAKRIVREIDVREKQNQVMAWPKNPISLVFYKAVMEGRLLPYKDDSLSSLYTPEEIINRSIDSTVSDEIDSLTGEPTGRQIKTANPFVPEERIKKYRIYEDWIFDKKESRMYVRIFAIAPLYKPKFGGQEVDEYSELCVLRYHKRDGSNENDIRDIMISKEVFNRQNDAARLTFDDWFEQRLFSSYIVKEANQHDLPINQQEEFKDNGLAALLESERIKHDLFEREHDLWEY